MRRGIEHRTRATQPSQLLGKMKIPANLCLFSHSTNIPSPDCVWLRKQHLTGILKWLLVAVSFWGCFYKCANKFYMSSFVLLSLASNLHPRARLILPWVNPLFSLEPMINDWTTSLPIRQTYISAWVHTEQLCSYCAWLLAYLCEYVCLLVFHFICLWFGLQFFAWISKAHIYTLWSNLSQAL